MLFGRLFGGERRRRERVAAAHYEAALGWARDPALYEGGVPDTFDGRFEMMVWHLVPIVRRLQREGAEGREVAQLLFDGFLDDMKKAMREAGVGDIAVPKRLQKMVRVWFGRVRASEDVGTAPNASQLLPILERNLYPDTDPPPLDGAAERIARRWAAVARTDADAMVQGRTPYTEEPA